MSDLRYLITTDPTGQVRISKLGHWGNLPHATEEEAEAAIRADARGKPYSVQRHRLAPLPAFRAHYSVDTLSDFRLTRNYADSC